MGLRRVMVLSISNCPPSQLHEPSGASELRKESQVEVSRSDRKLEIARSRVKVRIEVAGNRGGILAGVKGQTFVVLKVGQRS